MKLHISYYKFFDTNLVFKTNLGTVNEEFQKIYGYFKMSSAFSGNSIVCSLIKNDDSYCIDIKSPRYSTHYTMSGGISADAYLAMFSPIIYEVRDYFLIHAGSLATKNKGGIIISAPCGFGKTTLTMGLLKEGFGFLSDELAPINRHTGLVHPYPRGMGVLEKRKKKIVTHKGNVGNPCKLSCVIFLSLPQEIEKQGSKTRYVELALPRLDMNVYRRIEELPQIKEITVIHDRLFPILRLSVLKDAYIVPVIQEICRQNQVPIIYALRGKTTKPDFGAKPELKEISHKEGVFELSRNLLNTGNSALLEEVFGGSRAKMIFELAGLIPQTAFYTLTVGRLSEMIALIKNL